MTDALLHPTAITLVYLLPQLFFSPLSFCQLMSASFFVGHRPYTFCKPELAIKLYWLQINRICTLIDNCSLEVHRDLDGITHHCTNKYKYFWGPTEYHTRQLSTNRNKRRHGCGYKFVYVNVCGGLRKDFDTVDI